MYSAVGLLFLLPCIIAQDSTSTQKATTFALTYGYPLLAFQNFADQFLLFNATNYLSNSQELSSPSNKTVVKPNVDTLYSAALLDLSQSDVLLSIPELPDSQYALFSFYDIFGDNFANVGTGNVNGSGKYRVQGPQNGTFDFGVRSERNGGQFVADVKSPTSYGILLIRWGVNSSSINMVHQFQAQTTLTTMRSTAVAGAPPALSALGTSAIFAKNTVSPAEKCLQLLAKYAPWNQPETEDSAREVNSMLSLAGISNGMYLKPSGVDLDAANNSVIQTATTAAAAPANNKKLNNGWVITAPGGLAGNFNNGTAYAYRTAIASGGFLQLSNPNAVYPSWVNSSSANGGTGLTGAGGISLARDEALIYTFSGKPALMETGFWSLTAYLGNYLIPNNLKRYAIGNRNAITYSDGSLVYGSNATQKDGSYQILVQAADNPPPANWTSNWLPGPAGGGNVTVTMRLYGAGPGLLNGSYQYPVVTKQTAITSGGNGTNSTDPPSMTPEYSNGAASSSWGSRSSAIQVLACLLLVWWQI